MFILKFQNFPVPHEIRKGYGSMTHGVYVSYRTYELIEHSELIKQKHNDK